MLRVDLAYADQCAAMKDLQEVTPSGVAMLFVAQHHSAVQLLWPKLLLEHLQNWGQQPADATTVKVSRSGSCPENEGSAYESS